MDHKTRRLLLGLLALAVTGAAPAAQAQAPSAWTTQLDRPVSAKQLGLPAAAGSKTLARAALRRSAERLGLRGSLPGLQALPEVRAPRTAGARDLRTLRFRQTVGGLRVLYSQIDVAVVDRSVTSISATVVPVKSNRLRGAKRVSAGAARIIARRRVAGPDTALRAQPIAYAGTPVKPRNPRRAWVVQVTPTTRTDNADRDLNLCVVIDAGTGKVLEVWKGVAARRTAGRSARGTRAVQAVESNLFKIRDANFTPGIEGSTSFVLATTGNPYNYGEDVEFFSAHTFPPGAGILREAGKLSIDMQFVPRHMCLVRGYCGRDGGFDGTFNQFSITVRAPSQTNPPKNDRGTRYVHSQERVYIANPEAGSSDILAHELGHLVDFTYAEDRVGGLEVDEIEEALADMYAYDFDRKNATLGESQSDFTGSPRINWANPGALINATEKRPFPAHMNAYKCGVGDEHFNGTILSHAYHRLVTKLANGHDQAGAILHLADQRLPVRPTYGTLREAFERAAEDLFGGAAENAVDAAFNEVGVKDATDTCS